MEQEFLKLIYEHQGIIHRVARMYRATREDQEDLFQESVFQLWKAFPSFRRESKPSTWIYRIALNTAFSSFRKKSIQTVYPGELPEQTMQVQRTSDKEDRMFAALRQLNNSERAIVSLYLDDYSYKEIAEITGLSETNVGVKLTRIKTKLKNILN